MQQEAVASGAQAHGLPGQALDRPFQPPGARPSPGNVAQCRAQRTDDPPPQRPPPALFLDPTTQRVPMSPEPTPSPGLRVLHTRPPRGTTLCSRYTWGPGASRVSRAGVSHPYTHTRKGDAGSLSTPQPGTRGTRGTRACAPRHTWRCPPAPDHLYCPTAGPASPGARKGRENPEEHRGRRTLEGVPIKVGTCVSASDNLPECSENPPLLRPGGGGHSP